MRIRVQGARLVKGKELVMKAQVISFHCILKTKLGRVISSTFNHDVIALPGEAGVLPGLAEGLQNLRGGEKRRIAVPAARAYGYYDPDKVIVCSVDSLEGRAVVGKTITLNFNGQPTVFRVTEIQGEEVTLDANHPLAGEDLVFEIEALDVREARPEELDDGRDGPRYH